MAALEQTLRDMQRADASIARIDLVRAQRAADTALDVGALTCDQWPDPKPIEAALRPVPPFDANVLLPEVLRDWIMDEADRMPCPPEYVATSALAAAGSVIGAKCAIKPKARDSWLVVPNVWGGIVGPPAAKKSPGMDAAMKPLERLVAEAMKAYESARVEHSANATLFEARQEGIKSQIKAAAKKTDGPDLRSLVQQLTDHEETKPQEPIVRRFKTNDCTPEKLGELLRDNPAGILVHRDELVGLIASWDREGREGERAFFLEGWNGTSSFDTDRIGRGSIFISNLCLSVFGGIQPDRLVEYLEHAATMLGNDGMLQRFQLLVYPDHREWEWRDRTPNRDARNRVFDVFSELANFDPTLWGASPVDDFAKVPYFRFAEDALEVFIEWSADLHTNKLAAADHPMLAQHLSKYDKLFPALALILHLVDCAASGGRGSVSLEAAIRAAAWCEFLEAHARRCYGLLADDGLRAAIALAEKLRRGRLQDGFTARDVRRNRWRYLTTEEAVTAALEWLEDDGWLRSSEVGGTGPGSGRRTFRYDINPKVVHSVVTGTKVDTGEGRNHG